jgi:hypothetical protein
MNSPSDINEISRALRREWVPTMVMEPAVSSRPQRRPTRLAHSAALQPVLAIVAIAIASAVVIGAMSKAAAAWSGERSSPIAGAEQMRRQAQAVQAFRSGQVADAYGRFVALADDGDGGSALMALAMVRHGPALYGSDWSITDGQLRRWSAIAFDDVRRRGAQIATHDRGE